MLQLRSRETLDGGDHGWLKARHHFAVSPKGNLAYRPLGALVVWNDDEVAPGTGFGRHSHADMEIVTYVRQGAVTHDDSAGNVGRTVAGDVQAMSAGRGISHAEHNRGEEPLKLFQIWLLPRRRGGAPRWDSRRFPKADRLGATLLAGTTVRHALGRFRHAYLAPAQGAIVVNGQRVAVGDGIAAVDEPVLTITADQDAELILVTTA
jgi:quercetin 2,3-dioxygenase